MSSRRPEPRALPPALVQAWREDRASEVEVSRAYLKFLGKRAHRAPSTARLAFGWLVVGMLLGMGSLYAASAAPWRLLGLGGPVEQPVPVKASSDAKAPRASRATPVVQPAAPRVLPSAQAETEGVQPRPAPTPAPVASASENWQRAARAMRAHDFSTADDALTELSSRGSPAEREAAQLVRAQVLLSQGREAEALPLLRPLAASARSASVREKSTELLARAAVSHPSQRSFDSAEGTK